MKIGYLFGIPWNSSIDVNDRLDIWIKPEDSCILEGCTNTNIEAKNEEDLMTSCTARHLQLWVKIFEVNLSNIYKKEDAKFISHVYNLFNC